PETQKIAAPFRLDPPKNSTAHESGMTIAERQMMLISGQWQAETGQRDTMMPESGIAIDKRQQSGDLATDHFAQHQTDMLRFAGVQLLDLIPKIYDTKRALHILDDKGEKLWISIEPDQTEAVADLEHNKEDEEAVKLAFNPAIGDYECVSDPGPDFATQ